MRKVDENRAENYIRKHKRFKKWLVFALCVSLLAGSTTFYMLNKPATAMTEDGAKQVGLVLETADNDYEMGLIEQLKQNKAGESSSDEASTERSVDQDDKESKDNSSEGNSDAASTGSSPADDASDEASTGASTDDDKKSGDGSDEGNSKKAGNDSSSDASSEDKPGKSSSEDSGNSSSSDSSSEASSDASSESSSDASSEASSDASSEASSDASSEASSDASSEASVAETKEDVKITVHYVDIDGKEIAESKELAIQESLDLTKEVKDLDGYVFEEGKIDDEEIVKITKISESDDESAASDSSSEDNSSENNSSEAGSTDEDTADMASFLEESKAVNTLSRSFAGVASLMDDASSSASPASTDSGEGDGSAYYVVTTADGAQKTITDDTDLYLTYYEEGTRTYFEATDGKASVTALLSDPAVLPDGVELVISEISPDRQTKDFNAYVEALNNNADKLGLNTKEKFKYTYRNTLLYNIGFVRNGIEYEPKATAGIMITISLESDKIASSVGAKDPKDVRVVHLPVRKEGNNYNKFLTSKAPILNADNGIVVADVGIDPIDEKNDLEVIYSHDSTKPDTVSFIADSFSAYAIISNKNGIVSWEGSVEMSANDVVHSLGDSVMFGAVARTYEASGGSDIEANIAVGTLKGELKNYGLGNSTEVYKHVSYDGYIVTKNAAYDSTYKFGVYAPCYADGKLYYGNPDTWTQDPIATFEITTKNGTGSIDLRKVLTKDQLKRFARLYIFEHRIYSQEYTTEGKDLRLYDGDEFWHWKAEKRYTVNYDKYDFSTEEKNEVFGSYTNSYVENNQTGLKDSELYDSKLRHIEGNSLYIKNSDSKYTVYTYPSGAKTYNTGFPISISSLLDKDADASEKLAILKNSDDVVVVNAIGTQDGFMKDIARGYNPSDEDKDINYITNDGFMLDKNHLLVINLDLTLCGGEYTISQFKVKRADGKEYKSGENWDEIANQIIINPVQRDADNNFIPYTGKLILNNVSGTVNAPRAYVDINEGALPGTVIGNYVYQRREIHKITAHRFLKEKAKLIINNVNHNSKLHYSIPIKVDKRIDGIKAKAEDSGKFSFTMLKLDKDSSGKYYWRFITNSITNNGSDIDFTLYPQMYDMVYGNKKDSNYDGDSAHTYYFALVENDVRSDKYVKDSTAILVKVKYFDSSDVDTFHNNYGGVVKYNKQNGDVIGVDEEATNENRIRAITSGKVCFYRVNAGESSFIEEHPEKATSYYDDKHRIRESQESLNEDYCSAQYRFTDDKEKSIAFFNETASTSLRIHKMVVNDFGSSTVRDGTKSSSSLLDSVKFRITNPDTGRYIILNGFTPIQGGSSKNGRDGKSPAIEYYSKNNKATGRTFDYYYNRGAQWTIFGLDAGDNYIVDEVEDGLTIWYNQKTNSCYTKSGATLSRVTKYDVTVDKEGGDFFEPGGNNYRIVYSADMPNHSDKAPTNVKVGNVNVANDSHTQTVQVCNYYSSPIGPLVVTKNLSGIDWSKHQDYVFYFQLDAIGYEAKDSEGNPVTYSDTLPMNGQPMPQGVEEGYTTIYQPVGYEDALKNKDGTYTAAAQFYPIAFLYEGTYRYRLTEYNQGISGIKYDSTEYYIEIVVSKKHTRFNKTYNFDKMVNPAKYSGDTTLREDYYYLGADVRYATDKDFKNVVLSYELYYAEDPKTDQPENGQFLIDYKKGTRLDAVFNNTVEGKLTVEKKWADGDEDISKKRTALTLSIWRKTDKTDWEQYGTVQLSTDNNWTQTINNLDTYDARGNKFVYTVKEPDEYLSSYQVTYTYKNNSYNGNTQKDVKVDNSYVKDTGYVMTDNNNGDYGKVTITNEVLYTNVLPSTGGVGTTPFTAAGLMMILAAAMYSLIRFRASVKSRKA